MWTTSWPCIMTSMAEPELTELVKFRTTVELKDRLESAARDEGRTPSSLARHLIDTGLRDRGF